MYPFNQQGSQFQSNTQQPSFGGHYVQSHYQGQLSQPSFGQPGVIPSGYQSNSHQGFGGYASPASYQQQHQYTPASQSLGPVISRVGWQAGPDLQQSNNFAQANTGTHYSASHSQGYSAGPVISHYGYQAGPDSRVPVNQVLSNATQAHYQPQSQGYTQHYTAGYAAQGQHPVYQATNAYAQAGPVIQHFGGWESNQH